MKELRDDVEANRRRRTEGRPVGRMDGWTNGQPDLEIKWSLNPLFRFQRERLKNFNFSALLRLPHSSFSFPHLRVFFAVIEFPEISFSFFFLVFFTYYFSTKNELKRDKNLFNLDFLPFFLKTRSNSTTLREKKTCGS